MIRKLIGIPASLLFGIIKLVSTLIGMVMSLGFGTLRVVMNRLFGVLFGVLIGFFLGKKHLRFKLFTGKNH